VAKVKQGPPHKKKEKKLTFVDFQGVFCLEILGKQVSSPTRLEQARQNHPIKYEIAVLEKSRGSSWQR
jgi:hypothetical protein